MELITNNKGLILFYLFIIIFLVFMTSNISRNNDRMLLAKNTYIFTNN